jgi:hypothetical protein
MSEFDDETVILALEPGAYTHAVGIAMGSAEVLNQEGLVKFITLLFLDCEGSQVPVLLSLDGDVLQYLLSDTFQKHLREQVAETT